MTTSALVLPPALNNPNQKAARKAKPQQKAVLPPTARQLAEAIKSLCNRMRCNGLVEETYKFAILSVATCWSAVEFCVSAERAHQGGRKLKGDRVDYVGNLDKWLGQNRKADLTASDEDKEIHNLLLRNLPQGRALKLNPTETAVLTDWMTHAFGAPKASPLHQVDLPKVVKGNLRFANWFMPQLLAGDALVRFNAQMRAAKWGLLESIDAIFDAETSALLELVNAEESRREEAQDAATATAEEVNSVPDAEEPESSDADETAETAEAVAS